ncbi:titin [Oreochromis niloticus]|uniref:titin n=1 Tax=Oreochromis niloticus TaxID=8128 RepID=UPI000DF361CC|nr:titin [Oreochromis niloticus]
MKPLLRFSVPLWTLLVFSAFLKSTRAECTSNCTTTTTTTTTTVMTTTDVTVQLKQNSTLTVGNNASGNGLITGSTREAVSSSAPNCSDCSSVSQITPKPAVVKDLTVTNVTTTSVSLSWTKPDGGVDWYIIRWNGTQQVSNRTNETSFTIQGLTPGTQYNITVAAVNQSDEGDNSYISTFTKPAVVKNLTFTNVTTTSVTINWTKPDGGVDWYIIRWNGTQQVSNRTNETFFTIPGLTPGTQYSITVAAAVNQSIEGDNSYTSTFTKPAVVKNLTFTGFTTTSVSISWTKPDGGVDWYIIRWTGGQQVSNRTNETSFTIQGLTPGTQYNITVAAAVNQSIEGDNSYTSTFTRPENPGTISVTQGTNTLSISWILPRGNISYYQVNISNENLVFTNSSQTVATTTSFTYLKPGRLYNITVTAFAGNFWNTSDQVSFATVPKPPGSIIFSSRSNSSLQLQWATPDEMIGAPDIIYSITYQAVGGPSQNTTSTQNNTLLSLLDSGTNYTVTVKTIGPGNLSSTVVQNSSFTLPNPVRNLIVSPESTTSLNVNWLNPLEVKSYYRYLVDTYNDTGGLIYSTNITNNSTSVPNLNPGTNYSVTVRTKAAEGSESTVEKAFNYTMPKPVANLTVETVTMTSIMLTWSRQNDYKPSYSYLVIARQNGSEIKNDSTKNETYTLYNLTPGELYTFSVFTVIAGVKFTEENAQSYTIPEAVSNITAVGTTTSLSVSWTLVTGKVFSYSVVLNSAGQLVNRTVNNQTTNTVFGGLTPGVIYCVQLITKSGPYENNSSLVCNATFPNPPGSITVQSQTVNSINFTWALPQNMSQKQYNFSVTTTNNTFVKEDNWFLLGNLTSGSPYNISVVTVGVMGYNSASVTTVNYTRPFPVSNLTQTEITTNAVTLVWTQQESKLSYSYWVQVTNKSNVTVNELNVKITNATIINLRSGSNFNFTVTTLTADGTQADPVTVSYFTRPYDITELKAETINTTAINLNWTKPAEYRDDYKYRVATSGCAYKNDTLGQETIQISGLNPGTNCTFCVSVMAANGIEGQTVCTSQYTKPETVQPTISGHSNSSITVTWTKPKGNVERYSLQLIRNTTIQSLINLTAPYQFENLSAGREYSVMLTTISGPFNASSELVTNATFPNPPGQIKNLSKTTSSIETQWTEAPLMTGAKFYYLLTYTSSQQSNNINTTNTSWNFSSLSSGTSYNISVTTVGELGFQSETVYIYMVTTKPEVVTSLSAANITTSSIFVSWTKPVGNSSFYKVQWTGGGRNFSVNVYETSYNIANLTAGVQYEITVTAVAGDGYTEGQSATVTKYTKPEKVKTLTVSEIRTSSIFLNWTDPQGERSFYRVEWTDGTIKNNKTVTETKVNVTELTPGVCYTFTVTAVAGDNRTESDVATLSKCTKPEVVTSLSTANITTSSIFVSWTKPVGNSSFYKVQWTGGGRNFSVNVYETSYNIANLTAGVQYEITVTAVAGDNYTEGQSATVTKYTKPEKVKTLTVSEIRTSSIFLNWTDPQGERSLYRVEWTDGTIKMNKTVTETKVNVTELTPGVCYTFTVTAVAGDNRTESDVATLSKCTKPEVVTSLSAANITTSSIFVSWTKPVGNSSFYKVQWTGGGRNFSVNVYETSYNIANLTAGVQYEITVTAVAGDGYTQGQSATVTKYTKPEKVKTLTVSEIRTSSIFLNWTDPQGERSFYRVEWTDGTIKMNKTVTETKVNVTELTPGVSYTFTVTAVAGDDRTESDVATLSKCTKPEVVTSLSAANITTSSIFVSWTKPVGNSSFYKVQWTGGGRNFSVNVYETSYNIANLTAGVQYEITVTAVAGDGYTQGQSATVTKYTKPEKVKTLTVSEIRTSSIFLNWTDPQGERSFYRVEWTDGTIKNNKTVTETKVNVTELTPGVCYTFTVTAVAGDDRTESDVATLSKCTKPEVVTSLSAANITTSSIFVSWTKPVGNSSFYKVQWTGGGRNFSVNVYETSYNIANLTAGVQYEITVTAVAGDNYTEGQSATVTKYTKPEKVKTLTVSEIRTSSIFLNWTDPQGERSLYRVEWTDGTIKNNKTVTETKVNVTELTPGVCYTFTVTAVAGDNRTESDVATLSKCTKPEVVTSLSAANITTSSIFVSWTKPVGNSSFYKVQWTGGGRNFSVNVYETSYNIANLTAGVQYEITVTAVAGDGYTQGQSATVTKYTKPEKVKTLTVSEIRTSSIFLNWTDPQGERSLYRVEWTDGTIKMNKTVTETKVNVTELTPGVCYTFTVTAVAGDNRTESDVATLSKCTKPEVVTSLSAANITTSSIFVSWTKPVGNSSFYKVQWTGGGRNFSVNVYETSYNIANLTAGVQYEITVTAVAGDGYTQGQSATVTKYTKPEKVKTLTVSEIRTSSIFLNWTDPQGERSLYRVEWTDGTIKNNKTVTETKVNVTELTPGVCYTFTVTAVAGDNRTESDVATLSKCTKPEVVTSLSAANITTSSIFVSWTKPVGNSSFYKVQWTGGGRNFSVNVYETSYNIANLTAGVQYEITVTAVAGDGYTQGQSATVTKYTKPEKVKTLTVSEIRTSSIFLNWTDPQGERSLYRVEWTDGTIKNNKTVTETKVNVTELTPGVCYTFTVTAVAGDNRTESDVATLSKCTKPEVVTSLSAANITTSSIFVSWTKPVGNSSFYKVQWTGGGRNFSVNVYETSYNIANLTAGVQYEITVTAVAGDGYTQGQSATVTKYTSK